MAGVQMMEISGVARCLGRTYTISDCEDDDVDNATRTTAVNNYCDADT